MYIHVHNENKLHSKFSLHKQNRDFPCTRKIIAPTDLLVRIVSVYITTPKEITIIRLNFELLLFLTWNDVETK